MPRERNRLIPQYPKTARLATVCVCVCVCLRPWGMTFNKQYMQARKRNLASPAKCESHTSMTQYGSFGHCVCAFAFLVLREQLRRYRSNYPLINTVLEDATALPVEDRFFDCIRNEVWKRPAWQSSSLIVFCFITRTKNVVRKA